MAVNRRRNYPYYYIHYRHGGEKEDTHKSLAKSRKQFARGREKELIPYIIQYRYPACHCAENNGFLISVEVLRFVALERRAAKIYQQSRRNAEHNNEKEVVFGVGIVFGISLVIVNLRRIADLIFTAAVTIIVTEHLPLLGHIFNTVGVKIFFFAILINIKKVWLGVHIEHRSRSFHEEKIFIELMKKEYCGYDCEGKTDIEENSFYVYVFHSCHPFPKVKGGSGYFTTSAAYYSNHFYKFGMRNSELFILRKIVYKAEIP